MNILELLSEYNKNMLLAYVVRKNKSKSFIDYLG